MTTEQLLAPRYKVIADYPNASFNVGSVWGFEHACYYAATIEELEFDKYPHLFKKLEWWEERSESDMPQYVKCADGKVSKVTEYYKNGDDLRMVIDGSAWAVIWNVMEFYEPATEDEFIAYTQTVKP